MFNSIMMRELMNIKNPHIIDVRDNEEYALGVIPGALRMPLQELPKYMSTLSKASTYYVVCQSGSRSHMACQYLGNAGYRVINVLGGMGAYIGPLE